MIEHCARCARAAEQLVTVGIVHAGTGPGETIRACAECAPLYPPPRDELADLDAAQHHRRETAR